MKFKSSHHIALLKGPPDFDFENSLNNFLIFLWDREESNVSKFSVCQIISVVKFLHTL